MKNLISTSFKTLVIIVTSALLSYSCSKDKNEDYNIAFNSPAAFFDFGQSQTLGYTRSGNVSKLIISSTPEGWSAELNTSTGTVTVTAPDSLDESEDDEGETIVPAENGTVVLRGYVGDRAVTASLFVSLSDMVDLSSTHANSFILTRPMNGYRISATRPDGSAVEGAASADIVWMSARYLIRHIELRNGKITFTTYNDDNDGLLEGNALLAAKDADGNILWCWHLWVTKNDPAAEPVRLNGNTFMSCNLGAFGNSTDDEESILASYGLYYQWGRPTPFPRPMHYNCAGAATEPLFDSSVMSVKMSVAESDGGNSSIEAAVTNPLVFVTGLTAPWSGSNTTWSETAKSIYDPCPAGWRVPSGNVFSGLSIVAEELEGDMAVLDKTYGWTLTDGTDKAFFFAGGRRTYLDGSVVNMNTQETPKPWEGFYWSAELAASGTSGCALFFDLNTEDAPQSTLNTARQLQLSNGLQLRCVRE